MKDFSLYWKPLLPDYGFPIKICKQQYKNRRTVFINHWHEHMEFLYFTKGKAVIEVEAKAIQVGEGDLIIVNSNQLHYGESLSDELVYYCIIIDTSILESSFIDACELKYITPIKQGLILFNNKVSESSYVMECITGMIGEDEKKELGYELAIKAHVSRLLVLLMRNHVESMFNYEEYNSKMKNMEKLRTILKYIEENHTEQITVEMAARMSNLSLYYFCHLFKNTTGKTLSEYVNHIRINNAERLLRETDKSITEIALTVGFGDMNYFTRMFKRYKKVPPSMVRKLDNAVHSL